MFRLAATLGMTVAELETRMSSAELSEWIAYDEIEPIRGQTTDFQLAAIGSIVAKACGVKGAKIKNFIPWAKASKRHETGREMFAKLRAFAELTGAVVESK